ncbi:MAG: tetratricopeptide repeat protein [Thermodesulfobacteriota bacterium]
MQLVTTSIQLLKHHPIFLGSALLLFCQLINHHTVRAENISPSSSFQQGQTSFKKGDFAQALSLFKQAQAEGLNKPALFYNIGVCAYKLGLYEKAKEAFLQTATFPKMAALAYYNLAVLAEKQGDSGSAISWLKKSIATAGSKDSKILLLSKTALSRILSRQGLLDSWTSYSALESGYDDNVSMIEGDDLELNSEEEDSFADIFTFVRSPFLGNSVSEGPFLQGSLSFRDYTELNEYDVGSLRLEGKYRKKAGTFHLEGGTGYNYVLWDDASYSQSPIFNLEVKRPLGHALSVRLRYEAKYQDILNSQYDYLQGWQHQATTEFSARHGAHSLVAGYSFEENDRRAKDSSPRRHLIKARIELYPVDKFYITLAASYRDSVYDLTSSPDRSEERYEASLQLGYTLSKKWRLAGRYTHTVNISNEDLYEYRRNVTSLIVGYTF